jgi:hypothetical protein
MVEKMIEHIRQRKVALKAEAERVYDKMVTASFSCDITASIHYDRLQELNNEYLDLDMKLQEAEAALPPELPDTAPLFI